jgi:hypothetical protein
VFDHPHSSQLSFTVKSLFPGFARNIPFGPRRSQDYSGSSPYFFFSSASFFAALGETDQVFAWLEKAFRERAPHLVYLKVSPKFDPVRQDPRFAELLRKIGLEKEK